MTLARRNRLTRSAVILAFGIALAAIALTPEKARADEKLWAALVLASQVDHAAAAPPAELAHISGKVERMFGCNQVEILGAATRKFEDQSEHWLIPNQHFWINVKAKRIPESKYHLQITLVHDKRTLLETEANVAPDCPLLIRGPMHARGQLIIALQVLK